MIETPPLLEDLRRAAEAPAPKDFRPGITYSGRDVLGATINTGAIPPVETEEEWEAAVAAMGIHIPVGYGLVLERAELAGSVNDNAWARDPEHRGETDTAYTKRGTIMRWRYQFKVVLKDPRADADIAVLMKEAKRLKRVTPLSKTGGSMVISLADFQVGKTDLLGGTAELLERSEIALHQVVHRTRRERPAQIVIVDAGDSTEGFESSPNAQRTNDLQQTEQIRVWRRILWRWIDNLARLSDDVVVIGVPSNHCRVRQGKNAVGPALDDWGIEVIAQVADIAAVNDAYGHVRFIVPDEHREHVLFELADGKVLGVMHGHQASQPNGLPEKIKANARSGIGQADIVVVGHFHHLRVQAFGERQWLFVCPTMDSGSSWFANSGEESDPGVLTFMVDADGWRDMFVAWQG